MTTHKARQLRDEYEAERKARQDIGDDVARQGALIQRRHLDSVVSTEEFLRRSADQYEDLRQRYMAAIHTDLTETLSVTEDIEDRSFSGWPVQVSSDHNITLRNIWSRPGAGVVERGELSGDEHDALRIFRSTGITIEHASLSGAVDEILSIGESRGVIIRDCLISDPLTEGHPKGGNHGYGLLVVGMREQGLWRDHGPISIERCLFANCHGRTPSLGAGYYINGHVIGELRARVVNTVVFNPGIFSLKVSTAPIADYPTALVSLDLIGNLYIVGPDTDLDRVRRTIRDSDWDDVYAADNWIELPDGTRHDLLEWAGVEAGRDTPNFGTVEYIDDPEDVLDAVITSAGAHPRDNHDRRVVQEVRDR